MYMTNGPPNSAVLTLTGTLIPEISTEPISKLTMAIPAPSMAFANRRNLKLDVLNNSLTTFGIAMPTNAIGPQ